MKKFPTFPQENARIGLLGVAFDENSSYKQGSALAPQRIREAFFCDSANLWTEDETDLAADGIFADAGDITPSAATMPIETEQTAGRLYEAGLKVIAFGGDHSVTYPLVKAAAKHHPNLSILHFDAHPDLYDNFEDNPYSHASPFARIMEAGLKVVAFGGDHSVSYPLVKAAAKHHPNLSILHFDAHPDLYDNFEDNPYSHASPFARIMEAGLANRLVQVGIRTINGHQRAQAKRFGVEVLTMQRWRDVFDIQFDTPLYLSFDMDCLDPAFAPGISHWEPGGLSTREALSVIQSLQADIIGADIVELNPTRDPLGVTEMVAAKVFKEIVAKALK